tara:strand:- start:29352 stop:29576 length:225 start_codon:yes stop_codon:yes gene_type:complete
MNQQYQLLEYLKINHCIEPLQALDELGIYRLAAVIHDLRNKIGHDMITTERVNVKNRYGNSVSIARYWLDPSIS